MSDDVDVIGEVLETEVSYNEIQVYEESETLPAIEQDQDQEIAAENIRTAIEQGFDVLEKLATTAKAGEDAKMFESYSKLFKNVVDANLSLVSLNKQVSKQHADVINNTQVNITGNDETGSPKTTKELLSEYLNAKEEAEEVLIIEDENNSDSI